MTTMFRSILRLLTIAALVGVMTLQASGPVAVYALVDRVVFEPDEATAQRVQIWGAFSVLGERSTYSGVQSGYLYYRMNLPNCGNPRTVCDAIERSTRALWSDLKKVAGTGKAVGFGGNLGTQSAGKIRKASEKPKSPDAFPGGNPVVELGASQSGVAAELKVIPRSK
jgi:hypothetical protein